MNDSRERELAARQADPPTAQPVALDATDQFYAWERRGRGWRLYPRPVCLEPGFIPFLYHGPATRLPIDDGRKPPLLGALIRRLVSGFLLPSTPPPVPAPSPFPWVADNEPEAYEAQGLDEPLCEFQIALPPDFWATLAGAEPFLLSLSHTSYPVSFEIIGQPDAITVQLACSGRDGSQVRQALAAYFPEAVVTEAEDFLAHAWCQGGNGYTFVVDYGLAEEFMLPLKIAREFEPDPLVGMYGAMAHLAPGEVVVYQVLFEPVRHPWAESIYRAVTDGRGGAFFADAPQILPLAREKIGQPLYSVALRLGFQALTTDRILQIARSAGGGLAFLENPGGNDLIPLHNEDYDPNEHADDFVERRSRRLGMILNSGELVSLAHLPSSSVRAPKLVRETKKTKAAPALALGHPLILGDNVHAGQSVEVSLQPAQRLRHMHVIGASGTGKSTFLLNMIGQDIEHGEGLAVLDPHGDLIDQIIERIPESRWGDVVLLDPSDGEYPVGFNILSAHSELEKQLLASDLVSVFKRLSTSWGDQMSSVLGNAVAAFLESERGGTLADLRRFLVEKDYRERFLETVRDPEVVYYWRKEFPLLSGKPQGPLLTRLDIFLRPKPIRYMVAQKENRLDFARIMNEGKIFLAKLAQGAIGEENAYLLGTLLVSKFHQLALSRQEMREAGRRDFHLYIDEFHNFVTPSMASILTGARKYHLGLVLAHQEMRQLGSRDAEVTGAVLANPYTRVCFRLGDEDARKLADGFSFFEAKDLQNLGTGEAICRMERAEYDFNLKTDPLTPVDEAVVAERRERIVQLSRQRDAVRRDLVEAELARERPAVPPAPVAAPPKTETFTARPERPPVVAPPISESIPPGSQPSPAPLRAKPKPAPAEPTQQGRGGQKHKYLQQLIKQWAEGMGWRAEIEKSILDGAASVDVALSKGQVTVACEISVTTGVDQELGNIDKCLKAGFGHVVALSADARQVERIKDAYVRRVKGKATENIRFLTMEEFQAFVESLEAQAASQESTVRGYKVRTKMRAVDEAEKKAKKQALGQVIMDSMKKMRR